MGKFGLEQTSPILHNLKPLALSKAVRDSLGELGGRGGHISGEMGLAWVPVLNALKWS